MASWLTTVARIDVSQKHLMLCPEVHNLALQIHAHNLEPALQWVQEHRQQLAKQPQAVSFEFKLYRLSFLRILNEQGA